MFDMSKVDLTLWLTLFMLRFYKRHNSRKYILVNTNNIKNKKKYHTVRAVPKFYRKIVERGKIDATNTQIKFNKKWQC